MKKLPFFLAAATALLVPSSASAAQAYCDPRANAACYQRWCAEQGGTAQYVSGNWRCNNARRGGGGSSGGAQAGAIVGGAIGDALRDALFGNPQQEAERRLQQQRQAEEQQRRQAEIQRQERDRQQRLRESLLGFTPSRPDSAPAAGTRPGMRLMVGEEAERSLRNPAIPCGAGAAQELGCAAGHAALVPSHTTREGESDRAGQMFDTRGGRVDAPAVAVPSVTGSPTAPPPTPRMAALQQQLEANREVRERLQREIDDLNRTAPTPQSLVRLAEKRTELRRAEQEKNFIDFSIRDERDAAQAAAVAAGQQ